MNSISIPFDYHKRHDIEIDKLKKIVNSFRKLKICVIGDLIVDEYITCQPLGMSQEDTSIVVAPIDSSLFIGGASIVAAHASGLGANVKFISVTGNDSSRAYALDKLKEYGVSSYLLIDDNRPTSLKQRYRCNGKSLLRVSHLHQSAISAELQDEIIKIIDKEINEIDLLIFSDFNYGCLPQSLVKKIIERMKLRNVILAADSQSSSQVGDISRFNNMDLITPTEREARISTRNHEDGLVILAEALKKQANAKNIILKLGEEGILIHADINEKSNWLTDKVKALHKSPKDVSGAGDSLLIASALTLAAGGSIWEAASIGSVAAAIQVGRVGNIPIRLNEVLQELN